MSVLVVLRMVADATKLEALAEKDPTAFPAVAERAKQYGVISHRFYASDTEVMVVDEWETADGFQSFFDSSPEIAGFMDEAGVTGPPEVTVWRRLNLGDEIG